MAANEQTIARLAVQLILNDSQFQQKLQVAGQRTDAFGGKLKAASKKINGIFVGAMKAGAASLVAFNVAAMRTGAQFEGEMAKVGALAVDGADNIQALTDTARELGRQTSFSAKQAAQGMLEFARAGMTSREIMDASRPALLLAESTASNMSVATASLAATMNTFGIEAKHSSQLSDIFSATLKRSMFDLQGLTDAMKYGGVAGAAYGYDVQEVTAALASFRNMGLEATQAGTYYRQMLAQASKGSDKQVRILKEHGMTMEDINPLTNKFVDIMENLSNSTLDAIDIQQIFGSRAGQSVATLTNQFRDQQTEYYNLEAAARNSMGETERIWEQTTDTTAYQATVAKSALQDLMITMYDSNSESLKEFFKAITEVLNFTAQTIAQTDAAMGGSSMITGLDDLTQMLRDNKEEIAIGFIGLQETLASVFKWVVKIMGILPTLFKIWASIWVAAKVYAVIGSLIMLKAKLLAATVAAGGLSAAINTMTFGIPALIAALTAGIVTFLALSGGESKAQRIARMNIEANQRARDRATKSREEQAEAMYGEQMAQREIIRGLREELALRGDLNPALAQEFDHVESLTEAQILEGVATGKLIKHGEQYMTVRQAFLQLGEEEAVKAVTAAIEKQEGIRKENKRQMMEGIGVQSAAEGMVEHEGRTRQYWLRQLEQTNLTWNQYTDTLRDYALAAKTAKGAAEELTNELNKQETEIQNTDAAEAARLAEEEEKARKRRRQQEWKKILADRVKTSKKTVDAEIALQRRLAEATGDESVSIVNDYKDRSKALQEAFEEELKAWRHNAEAVAAIRDRMAQAMKQEATVSIGEMTAARRKAFEDEARELEQAGESEIQALRRRNQERLTQLGIQHKSEIQIARDTGADVQALRMQHINEQLAMVKQNTDRLNSFKRQKQVEIGEELAEIQRDVEGRNDLMITQMAKDRLLRLENMEHMSAIQRIADDGLWREQVLAQAEQMMADSGVIGQKELTEVERLEQEKAAILAAGTTLSGEEQEKIAKKYDQAILKEKVKNVAGWAVAVGKGVAKVAGAVSAAMSGIKNISTGVMNVFDGIASRMSNLVAGISGFQFSLGGMVSDLASAKMQAAESGEAFSPAKAAQDMINELFNNADTFIEMFVMGAPVFMQGLAEGLPSLLQKIAEALPKIIQSVVDAIPLVVEAIVVNFPLIIDALVGAIPVLVNVLVTQLPVIIDFIVSQVPKILRAIISAIPALIGAVMGELPKIIGMIADAIVMIVKALPKIFEKILKMLPDIIMALMLGLTDILQAVIRMIPKIIFSFIEQLPTLISALMNGVMQLVIMLAAEIPNLITQILMAIPLLIQGLISSIGMIIEAVLLAIPDIVIGFISALPQLITAIVMQIPYIVMSVVMGLVKAIPQIISALVFGIILRIPEIVLKLIAGIVDGIGKAMKDIGKMFGDMFKDALGFLGDLFGKDEDGDGFFKRMGKGLKDGWDKAKDWFSYSGVDYVPANMRMTVHKGEAIIPASRNPFAGGSPESGVPNPAQAGAGASRGGGGGGNQPIEVVVTAEGRVLDAVQTTAMKRGHAPGMTRELRRRSGVDIGFNRGNFQYWTKK